jgi:hypothetical protein
MSADERPLTLDELLTYAPADLPIQVEVKAHADPKLARRTAAAVYERNRTGAERRRLGVDQPPLGRLRDPRPLTAFARGWWSGSTTRPRRSRHGPYAVGSCGSRSSTSCCPRSGPVFRLAGLSVNTGTVNDAELLARITELAARMRSVQTARRSSAPSCCGSRSHRQPRRSLTRNSPPGRRTRVGGSLLRHDPTTYRGGRQSGAGGHPASSWSGGNPRPTH